MPARRALALLVLALLVAGCTGGDAEEGALDAASNEDRPAPTPEPAEPPVVTAPPPSSPSNESSAPPSTSSTPAPTPPTPPSPEPAPEEEPPAPRVVTTTVFLNASLGSGARACSPQQCAEAMPGEDAREHAPPVEGGLIAFTVALTWNASSELTKELTLVVETCDAYACGTVATLTGESPLLLSVPDAASRGNPLVRIEQEHVTPAEGVDARAAVEQPYALEGTFTHWDLRADGNAWQFAPHDGEGDG